MAGEGGISTEDIALPENAVQVKKNPFKEALRKTGEKIRVAKLFSRSPQEKPGTTLQVLANGTNEDDPFAPPQLSPLSSEQLSNSDAHVDSKEAEQKTEKIDLPSIEDFPEKARPYAEMLLGKVTAKTADMELAVTEFSENIGSKINNYGAVDSLNNRLKIISKDLEEYILGFGRNAATTNREVPTIKAPYSGLPFVSTEVAKNVQVALNKLTKFSEESEYLTGSNSFFEIPNGIKSAFKDLEIQEENNESLAKSEDVLTHQFMSGAAAFTKTLEAGQLLSRKKQIELFGETYFTTAMAKIGKDHVKLSYGTYKDTPLTHEQYKHYYEQEKSSLESQGIKNAYVEENQVLFAKGNFYRGWNAAGNKYQLSIVFREPDILGEGQFKEDDGIHVFDKNYKEGDPQTPGYGVDLTQKPFLLVIGEEWKNGVEGFVRDKIAVSPKWQNIITPENVDDWLARNVVIVPKGQKPDMNAIRAKMKEIHGKKELPKGYVVPSGEYGDRATNGRKPLVMYKEAS